MKITKIGHSCLVIEEEGVKILTDPGAWTQGQNELGGLDVLLITHEHADHFHMDSIKTIVRNNPDIKIFCNRAVRKILDEENISNDIIEDGEYMAIRNVTIEGYGKKHDKILPELSQIENTGYRIGGKLFFPGDAFTLPKNHVDILALPIAGPWLKLSESIQYAKDMNPNICFPIHDGMLKYFGSLYKITEKALSPNIRFITLEEGKVYDMNEYTYHII